MKVWLINLKTWVKRWKWYLISGTSIFVAILTFAIIVYINMTPTLEKDANTADKIFDFLDKWASAGAPAIMLIAIAVALGVGLAGILQTRNIQRNEQKQKMLNEIVEWARSIITWRVRHKDIFRDIARSTGPIEGARLTHAHLAQVLGDFAGITGLNEYMRKVALRLEEGLPASVEKLINDTGTYTEFLEQRFKELTTNIKKGKFDEDNKVIEKTEMLAKQMVSSASNFLVLVATMKSGAIA